MNVKEIQIENFMSHESSRVLLPERGVVLVTGPNGSGKSTLIESVSMACWGKTLRGTFPWNKKDGFVRVSMDELSIERAYRKNKTLLDWSTLKEDKDSFVTTSKAQDALEKIIGSQWLWQRTHVLSVSDVACFTQSTDGERKRLLEAFIGLEKFDDALKQCRCELQEKELLCNQTERSVELSESRLQALERLVRESEETLKSFSKIDKIESVKALSAHKESLVNLKTALVERQEVLVDERCEMMGALNTFRERHNQAQSKAKLLKEHSECPTCQQVIPDFMKKSASVAAEQSEKVYLTAIKKFEEQMKGINQDLSEVTSDQRNALDAINDLDRRIAKAEEQARLKAMQDSQRNELKTRCESARVELEVMKQQVIKSRDDFKQRSIDVLELTAVEKVLGLRGVRAHVLGSTLAAIEQMANAWLQKIAGEQLRLHLKPYQEKKTGGVTDAIGLEIAGAGGGYGYQAASAGERRRIDVALLFALAEIAAASQGTKSGTLFVDECFDGLDSEGVPRVIEVINELASERVVVVITHDEALRDKISPLVHLRVSSGQIREVS